MKKMARMSNKKNNQENVCPHQHLVLVVVADEVRMVETEREDKTIRIGTHTNSILR